MLRAEFGIRKFKPIFVAVRFEFAIRHTLWKKPTGDKITGGTSSGTSCRKRTTYPEKPGK
jgi:hypothetical protein